MHRAYQLVIFDWEGTIGEDTTGQVFNALTQEASRLHFGEFNRQQARQCVELGLAKALPKIFPGLTSQRYEQLLDAVQQTLIACPVDICLVPDAKTVIQKLHEAGFSLAIATNKGQASLQRCLRHSGLDAFFQVTRSAGQVPPKPCPQMLEEIMAEFGVGVSDTLMIGDSLADMEMAHAIQMTAIGVDFHHLQTAELYAAGAQHVFHHYQEIAQFLSLMDGGEDECFQRLT